MGNNASSSSSSSIPLTPQPRFPRVINQRFVDHQRQVSFLLEASFFLPSESKAAPLAEIRDVDLDTIVFKVRRPSPHCSNKLLLLDGNGVAAVALEGFTVASQLAFYEATNPLMSLVKRQTETKLGSQPPVFVRVETSFHPGDHRLRVDLVDSLGNTTLIRCRGRWESHDAYLYIDRNMNTGKRPDYEYIVRVEPLKLTRVEKTQRKASGRKSKPYKVTIAPGVDVAFVVLVCAAMDREASKKNEVFRATEEETARLAERPLHHVMRRLERLRMEEMGNNAIVE